MITKIPNPNYSKQPVVLASEFDRKEAERAADGLDNGFNWDDTAEGSDFWAGVCNRLRQIARDRILKD